MTSFKQLDLLEQPVEPEPKNLLPRGASCDPLEEQSRNVRLALLYQRAESSNAKPVTVCLVPYDGPHLPHQPTESCWCEPVLNYVDEDTGAKVWVHRRIQ